MGVRKAVYAVSGILGLASLANPVAQVRPSHEAGLLLPAHLDGDASEDFLVDTGQVVHAWFGRGQAPWLVEGPATSLPADGKVRKVLAGGHLYFVEGPHGAQRRVGDAARLAVWTVGPAGDLAWRSTFDLPPSTAVHELSIVKLCPAGFDLDGDGGEDVLAVWCEQHVQPGVVGRLRAAWVSPTRRGPVADLRWVGSAQLDVTVAALHRAGHVGNVAGDVLCTVTQDTRAAQGGAAALLGFGFVQLGRGPGDEVDVRGARWIGGVPGTAYADSQETRPSVVYGAFAPSPALAVPAVRTTLGPTVVLHPDFVPPFVDAAGGLLHTGPGIEFLGSQPADFDGDGADEVVFLLDGFWPGYALMLITDPHPRFQPRWEAHWWSGPMTQARHRSYLRDAAPVDVDGDGDADLVVSGNWTGVTAGDLGFLRQEAAVPASGTPGFLRRVF